MKKIDKLTKKLEGPCSHCMTMTMFEQMLTTEEEVWKALGIEPGAGAVLPDCVRAVMERMQKAEKDAYEERRIREMFGKDIGAIMEAFGTPIRVEQADLPGHVRRLLRACQSLHRRWRDAMKLRRVA